MAIIEHSGERLGAYAGTDSIWSLVLAWNPKTKERRCVQDDVAIYIMKRELF
jgi:hypothetical protein